MDEPSRIAAIVLAAGRSERMQYPKPLLIFGKETVLDRVIRIEREAGADPVIVVLGHDAERIRANAALEGAAVTVNPDPERGQTSSLQAGLRGLPADAQAALIHPADCALVASATIASLIEAYHRSPAPVVALSHEGKRGHPVLCDRSMVAKALALDPGESLRSLFAAEADAIRYVETDDAEVLRDLDTPADYYEALEVYSARGGEAGFAAPRGTAGRAAPRKPPVK
jgi:molybdenum cofactor cytidylyltransferase